MSRITNNDVPKQIHMLGDGSSVEFPLRVLETCSVDSKENYSVQLCDILAGLANKSITIGKEDKHHALIVKILGAGLGSINYNGIRFEPIFPENGLPNPLDGDDIVDQMVKIMGTLDEN